MDVQIVVRGVEDDKVASVREYADEKLRHALDRFEERVLSATVRVEDVTGPEKQGVDKQCKIDVRMRGSELHIDELGDNFTGVINTAMDRLRAAMSREVAKNKRGIGEG